jgi:hypothetical protein
MTVLATGVIILSVLAVIFWFVFFALMYAWTAGSPDDPKFFKPAFFVTWIQFLYYFLPALLITVSIVGAIYLYSFIKEYGLFQFQ